MDKELLYVEFKRIVLKWVRYQLSGKSDGICPVFLNWQRDIHSVLTTEWFWWHCDSFLSMGTIRGVEKLLFSYCDSENFLGFKASATLPMNEVLYL